MDAYEQNAVKKGFRFVAGVDEAGRGPLAGPVVAAAVIFPPIETFKDRSLSSLHLGIRDSKTLSPLQRNTLLPGIFRLALAVGVGIVWMDEINTINIHRASLKAMAYAVNQLKPFPDFILIDGSFPIDIPVSQLPVVKGDSKSVSIAAASIVAKTVRDRIMDAYHRIFPSYNFNKNKGYGTAKHLEAIKCFGPSSIHRKTFRGVKEYLT